MNTWWLGEEKKICTYTEQERGQDYARMFLALSYRISSTNGLTNMDIFYFTWHPSSESGQFQGRLCSWTVSWRTQMFFIFILSHPQIIGDFFHYSCKMDGGVPDVTWPCPAKRRCFLLVCIYLWQRKNFHRCFSFTSTHALADKGHWVDTNSDWHKSAREQK